MRGYYFLACIIRGSCANPNLVAVTQSGCVLAVFGPFSGRFRAVSRPHMRPECMVLANSIILNLVACAHLQLLKSCAICFICGTGGMTVGHSRVTHCCCITHARGRHTNILGGVVDFFARRARMFVTSRGPSLSTQQYKI
jgi:hypothetical protein